MANLKVSEMTEATTFDDEDYTMIVQANQNKKIKRESIFSDIENNISTINTNIGDLTELETSDTSNIINGINSLLPVTLYSNTSGSNSDLTLNDAIENYKYYEIYFSRGGNGYTSIRMSTDYLSDVSLITSFYLNSILRFYIANITILGTSLTRNYTRLMNVTSSNTINQGADTSVLIYKIIGYK